jgi:hypothetical protein
VEHDLPDLDVVSIGRLVLHEDSDPARVARIARALARDRTLVNPPVVGRTAAHRRLVVLDGANRVSALERLRVRHALVQVVDYDAPSIRLGQWHHLLVRFDPQELLPGLVRIPGAKLHYLGKGPREDRPVRGGSAAIVRVVGAGAWSLRPLPGGRSVPDILRDVTGIYRARTPIYRIADEALDSAARQFADVTAVVLFPRFTKREIVHLSLRRREKLPTGITKHRIPQRALRVYFPLSVLRSPRPLRAKRSFLRKFVAARVRDRKVRYYPESTVLFDE